MPQASPKRLLSMNSYHYRRGGSDIVYLDHAALFERRGWSNTFFAMHHPNNLSYALDRYFADRVDYEVATGTADRLRNASRIIYSRQARQRLGALLDAHPVDVAHLHIVHHHLSPSVLVELKRRGIPAIVTAHDLKLACPNYKMMNGGGVCERCKGGRVWNVLRHRCIKGSLPASGLIMVESALHKALDLYGKNLSAIVTPSQFYRDKLIEWGWSPRQLHYIPNFVALPPAPDTIAYGAHVLFFGRLAPEKGVATLIRAAAQSRVPVAIVGSGPDEAMLRALATALDAPVTFLGFLSGQALWAEVESCRAVVLPSEWYENAPVSVLEAFARLRPVAGAQIGGIPELITAGVNGWHFRSGDVGALAATLAAIRDTPDAQLASMGQSARRMVAETFSEEKYYAAMSDLYDRLLAENAAASPVGGPHARATGRSGYRLVES